jgi:hypothetical protein
VNNLELRLARVEQLVGLGGCRERHWPLKVVYVEPGAPAPHLPRCECGERTTLLAYVVPDRDINGH